MSFDRELKNELFSRVTGGTTSNDVENSVKTLETIHDPNERLKLARQVITRVERYGEDLISKSHFRNAAYQFYLAANIVKKYVKDKNEENRLLLKAADILTKAADEYIAWNDLLGGAAYMTISALFRIQAGDLDVNKYLESFIKGHDFSASQEATACLYIPYDLVAAINPDSPSPNSFQRAMNYTESYLLSTKYAASFQEGIRIILEEIRQKLMRSLKYPRLRATYSFDQDIIFGEPFKFGVTIENIGEGKATAISVKITIPNNIKIKKGDISSSIETLDPDKSHKIDFELICPTGEGEKEITTEIGVSIEYQDLLLNKNSVNLGPATITIRAEKKSTELFHLLEKTKQDLVMTLQPMQKIKTEEAKEMSNSIAGLILKIINESKDDINEGKFSEAETRIDHLEKLKSVIEEMTNFLTAYNDQVISYSKTISEIKDKSKEVLKVLNEAEKIVEDI